MVEIDKSKEAASLRLDVSRVTTIEDLARYVAFERRIFAGLPEYYPDAVKQRLIASVGFEYTLPLLDNPAYQFVQVKDAAGEIVGFGNGKMRSFDELGLPRMGFVTWLGVDPSYRGRGTAGSIIKTLEEGFAEHDAPMAVCFIKDRNTGSIRSFAKRGYITEDRIPPAFGDVGPGGRFYSKQLRF